MTTTAPETEFVAEPGSLEATTTAVIDAPRETVFRCYVEPGLLARWWAPPKYEVKIEALDPTPGGSWRFLVLQNGKEDAAFRGVCHGVIPNESICQTFEWEGLPGHVCMQTATFEDAGGGTKVTEQIVFQSVADRDGMAEAGMKEQAPVGMAQLSEVARSL
jgi:uncharacterized protein YndB with AHSA1/START domain